MPRTYWDYDSVNIQWGVLENYEVVRKIGTVFPESPCNTFTVHMMGFPVLLLTIDSHESSPVEV